MTLLLEVVTWKRGSAVTRSSLMEVVEMLKLDLRFLSLLSSKESRVYTSKVIHGDHQEHGRSRKWRKPVLVWLYQRCYDRLLTEAQFSEQPEKPSSNHF